MTTTTQESALVAGLRRRIMLARADRGGDNITIGRTSVATIERGHRRDSADHQTPVVPVFIHVVMLLANVYDVRYTDMLLGWDGWEDGAPPPKAHRRNPLNEDACVAKIAAFLRRERQRTGKSQAAFAALLGVNQSTYSRYEAANTRWTPTIDDFQKLLDHASETWEGFIERFTRV